MMNLQNNWVSVFWHLEAVSYPPKISKAFPFPCVSYPSETEEMLESSLGCETKRIDEGKENDSFLS